MLKIGLTGGIGSGKSAATATFQSLGITVIDADIVARQVVEPNNPALSAIVDHFGPTILNPSQSLDRKSLRQIIFSNPDEKHWLESLLHPLIRDSIIQQLSSSLSPYTILSSPLLFETNQHELVDRTLLIDAPVALQLQRACSRDDTDEEQIRSIIDQQMSRQCKTEKADDIILNNEDLQSLQRLVLKQHNIYMDLIDDEQPSES